MFKLYLSSCLLSIWMQNYHFGLQSLYESVYLADKKTLLIKNC